MLAGNSLGDGIISIPAFREEGDMSLRMFRKVSFISIPAFREEGDDAIAAAFGVKGISIPAFREEGDQGRRYCNLRSNYFNPRLP